MRINIGGHKLTLPLNKTTETLAKLLAKGGVLRGEVRRLTISSAFIFLQNEELEVEVPLSFGDRSLAVGQIVELMKQDERGIALRILPTETEVISVKGNEQVLATKQLEQVLVELNIPATAETIQVAEGLLQRGFPLQEGLMWSLLPWAEKGLLEEALSALQAKFPLKPEILEMATKLQERSLEQPILEGAREQLSLDLQELFEKPTWGNRTNWSNKFSEGDVFKTLVRLLVEERFAESLQNNQSKTSQFDYVFALPFLREEDLHAAWVRIKQEDAQSKDEVSEKVFRVEFEIPTTTFGIVKAELCVRGNNVTATFKPEGQLEVIEDAFEKLAQELKGFGWNLIKPQLRGDLDA